MVMILTLVFTGVLILFAASMSGSARNQLAMTRDESEALRAEMASESGLEFARRQFALNADWNGTDKAGVPLADGGRFIVTIQSLEDVGGGATEATFSVTGINGEGAHKFSSVVRITPGGGGVYPYALLFLGKDFTMSHGMVYGDVLFADRANKVNDWLFDAYGDGYYADSNGPAADGKKEFVWTGVDGTVYKYRDDLTDYQWLGKEVIIEGNTNMPSWDLDDFAVPGPGKKILTNPHNVGNKTWALNGVTYEETVVINLLNKQTVTLTNCNFKGGLVVLCPDDYDMRSGSRNLVHLKKGTKIGGGSKGVAPNIGLIAPGGKLKNETNPNTLSGFHLVNEVDLFRNSTITGQMVILNACKEIRDCVIKYDPAVTENLPPWFGYRSPSSTTEIVSLYEDFE
jgi:hypothetical protein